MNDHQRLLLAVCIGEWSTALDHIEASIRTGFIKPVPYATLGRVRQELRDLLDQWALETERLVRFDTEDDEIVQEARAYCTEHQSEIDALTHATIEN